jgi:hypothetical protein
MDRGKRGLGLVLLLAVVFVGLRLVDLGSIYLWIDDVHSLSYTDLRPTPWRDLLGESFQHSLDTTGPVFPTLVLKTINNVVGSRALALRLPAVVVGLLSFLMLYRVLARLFDDPGARFLPLVLFTFSVPSIIYSQAIQPSIYYFLGTAIQLDVFARMAADLKPYTSTRDIFRKLQIFALVSTLVFFLSFMSALIYGLLVGCYVILIAVKGRGRSGVGRKVVTTSFNALVVTIPLLSLAWLRALAGEVSRPYFEGLYYLDSWKAVTRIPRLTYDLLSYHFNFAYDPHLYIPLGNNWLSLPFVLLVAGGAAYWLHRRRAEAAVPLAWAVAVILGAGALKGMPYGGLRHSFTLAPFLYVAVGYGVMAVPVARWRYALSGAAAGLALVIFALSGVHLYADRQSTLDIKTVHTLAEQYETQRVIGYCEAYLILGIWQESSGGTDDLDLAEVCQGDGEAPDGTPYLVVDYRHTFDPDPTWPALAWNPAISREMFAGARITPLIEDVGPLDPHRMGVQSIYYPMNGFFVYLVEPGE